MAKFVYVGILKRRVAAGESRYYNEDKRVALNPEQVETINQVHASTRIVGKDGSWCEAPITIVTMVSGDQWTVPFEDYEVVEFLKKGLNVTAESVGRAA